jgi:hypothetical protein
MTEQRRQKLNQLQQSLPEGLLADAAWLKEKGYSSALRSQYVSAGWLDQPARGVYRRPSGKLQWQHVLISVQTLLKMPVIAGGRTALELQGFAHYLPLGGMQEVHLYGDGSLPSWVHKLKLDIRFVFHNARKLFREERIGWALGSGNRNIQAQSIPSNASIQGSLTRQAWGHWDWLLVLSTPERAILELLDEVPQKETFHQAEMLMGGLRTLRPSRLQRLLEDCRSVKVKRLFLWFAERHGFRWLSKIKRERIDLGKGKRMLVRGGKLDSKFLITVPEDMNDRG